MPADEVLRDVAELGRVVLVDEQLPLRRVGSASIFGCGLLLHLTDFDAGILCVAHVSIAGLDVVEQHEGDQKRCDDDHRIERPVVAVGPRRDVEMKRLHEVNTPVHAASSDS